MQGSRKGESYIERMVAFMPEKKLYRSKTQRMLCGVCGGIGEYFNIDPTLIRLLFVLFGCTGGGILAYIIAAIIIPDGPM